MKTQVLIVEDDPDTRDVLSVFLNALDYKVFAAESRDSAIEIVKTADIFCILLDWNMPGMACEEFIVHLKSIFFRGHIIMLSAGPNAEAYAKKCGIVCVEKKPIDAVKLAEALKNCHKCKPIQAIPAVLASPPASDPY